MCIRDSQYAAFTSVAADDVVNKALEYVFAKDKDFLKYMETSNDAKPTHPLRIKRSNDDAPKGKPGRKPATSVHAPAAIPMANAAAK